MNYTEGLDEYGNKIYIFECECCLCGKQTTTDQLIPPKDEDCINIVCSDCYELHKERS